MIKHPINLDKEDHLLSINVGRFILEVKLIHLVFLSILLSCILRLNGLEIQSLWYDEIHSVNQSDPDLTFDEIITYSRADQPPLFFLLLHGWFKIFGYNDFSARLFVALIGVLGVISIYFLGKEIHNKRTGAIATFLTSLNFFHIQYSQEVRFYSLVFLLSTISYLFFIRSLRDPIILNLFGYYICTTSIIYTHYYGLVVVASQALLFFVFIIHNKSSERFIFKGVLTGLAVFISIIPWLPQYLNDTKITQFWIEPVKFPRFIFAYFYHYFGNILLSVISGGMIIFYFIRYFRFAYRDEYPVLASFIVLGWIILGYLIPFLYSSFIMPMLVVRYTIIVLPAIIILLALGINLLNEKLQRYFLLIFCCISLWALLYGQHYYRRQKKEQIREIVKEVIKHESKKPQIIFSYYAWHFNYYFKTLNSSYRAIHPTNVDYEQAISKVDFVWLIQCHEDNAGATNEQLNLINQSFREAHKVQLIGAQAVLYQREKTSDSEFQ